MQLWISFSFCFYRRILSSMGSMRTTSKSFTIPYFYPSVAFFRRILASIIFSLQNIWAMRY